MYDQLLQGVRGKGAIFGASALSPSRALRFIDGPSLTLCIPLRGEGWLIQGDTARSVSLGEAAVVRGPEPFIFAATESPRSARDVRSDDGIGGDLAGETVLLTGTYQANGEVARRLVRVLPPMLVVPDDHDCSSMRTYLESQLIPDRPGRQTVLDRLLDWLLVCTLRDWFDQPEAVKPGWYAALSDHVVGPVLLALHDAPSKPWTLASLAAIGGVSRTTLARRFTELVGEPPLAYLTAWRMALAADMLADPHATVSAVARTVGYSDAFGFSSAFKRTLGESPSAYRRGPGPVPDAEERPAGQTEASGRCEGRE